MARGQFPSDRQDQFMVRFPDGMRELIKAAADANGRSMNAEIIARIEGSFEPSVDPKAVADAFTVAEEMRARFERLAQEVQERSSRVREAEEKLRRDRLAFERWVNEKREELAKGVWQQRAGLREELEQKKKRLSEQEERFREYKLSKERMLADQDRSLSESIVNLNAREKELSELIRNLSSGASMLAKK